MMYYGILLPSNRKKDMRDRYWLPPRTAWLCRVAGSIFLLSAVVILFVIAFAGLTPGASPYCGQGGCVWNPQPTTLLDSEERMQVEKSPGARRTFEAYVSRPGVRLRLAGIEAIESIPFALLLLSVGLALRRLGGRGADALGEALAWLRRASLAAIVWTLASPVYESLLETVLSPGTPSGAGLQISIYLADLATGLLLAIAAYAAIWAMEAGLRAQRDLENFV